MKCFINWIADLKSSKPWSSQLWTQFKQLRLEAWKSQDFNGVWTSDLAIPVRRSNQLSYEATDVGSRSFVSSNEPVKNGFEVIYMKCFIYWTADLKSSKLGSSQLWTHKWPAPNVSGFIAQLFRASHRYREVTGSKIEKKVEILSFSGFCTQLLKLRS